MSQNKVGHTKNLHTPKGSKITLYQLTSTSNGYWYYRFKNPLSPTRYIRKSSREISKEVAFRVASEHYEDLLVKSKLGLTEDKPTLLLLIDTFIDGLPQSTHVGIRNAYKNYWSVHFKDRDLFSMRDNELKKYVMWRQDPKNYRMNSGSRWKVDGTYLNRGVHAVAKATIQHECKYLRYFFRRAVEASLIQKQPDGTIIYKNYPHITVQETSERRGRFTDDQLKVLRKWRENFMKDWKKTQALEKEGKKSTHADFGFHTITRYSNITFYVLISMVLQTGIRPVESKELKFKDIRSLVEDGEEYCWIDIRREVSKIGKRRQSICTDMSASLRRFEMYKVEWERMFKRPPTDEDYIFANPRDPLRVREFSRMFRHQLERVSEREGVVVHGNFIEDELFPDSKAWKQNVLYSIRSAYISNSLRNGVPLYHLSRQVGASESQIEKTYNVNTNLMHKEFYTHHVLSLRRANKGTG